jgi:prephenate dehydratase
MKTDISHVDIWSALIEDRPGAVAEKLGALAKADIDLEFVISRRSHTKPGTGIVYVTPIKGPQRIKAAMEAGFEKAKFLHEIRIATGNKPGYSSEVTMRMADAGINLRSISGASIGNRAVFYVAFDSDEDAKKAIRVLKQNYVN